MLGSVFSVSSVLRVCARKFKIFNTEDTEDHRGTQRKPRDKLWFSCGADVDFADEASLGLRYEGGYCMRNIVGLKDL